MGAVLPSTLSPSLAERRELPAGKEEVRRCRLCRGIVNGLFANTAQQSLFTMTASYSGTHGPARGDCKLCNSAVKQRGIMAKRKGQTVDGSLGPKCECADLGCAAREEGLQQLRKPGGPVTGLLVRVGFTFF